jgi:hypothetical protein
MSNSVMVEMAVEVEQVITLVFLNVELFITILMMPLLGYSLCK